MQANTHPSEVVWPHFIQIGLQYYLKCDNKKHTFALILGDSDHIYTVMTSTALPFATSTAVSQKTEQNIAALTGMVHKQIGSMYQIVAAVSQIDNHIKQTLASSKWRFQEKQRIQEQEQTNSSFQEQSSI
jgi:nitrate reductase beta subunit